MRRGRGGARGGEGSEERDEGSRERGRGEGRGRSDMEGRTRGQAAGLGDGRRTGGGDGKGGDGEGERGGDWGGNMGGSGGDGLEAAETEGGGEGGRGGGEGRGASCPLACSVNVDPNRLGRPLRWQVHGRLHGPDERPPWPAVRRHVQEGRERTAAKEEGCAVARGQGREGRTASAPLFWMTDQVGDARSAPRS